LTSQTTYPFKNGHEPPLATSVSCKHSHKQAAANKRWGSTFS